MVTRQEKEKEHFDKLADKFEDAWWGHKTPAGKRRLTRRAEKMTNHILNFKDPKVLEIGCGTGSLTKYILENNPKLKLIGCDISPKQLEVARRNFKKFKNARFEEEDITKLSYKNESFDVIFGNSILHHLPLGESLKECFRVLKKGGIFMFFEPNMVNPEVALEKNVPFIAKLVEDTEDETAFFRWKLKKVLEKEGFSNVSVLNYEFLHPAVPEKFVDFFEKFGMTLEKIPIVKEVSGSLFIYAKKPK